MAKIRKKNFVGQQMYGLLLGGSYDYFDDGGADVTPPVISNVQVTLITTTTATITWTTDEASDSRVDYGLTSGYGSNQTDGSSVTSHSVQITGLTANTLYHFKVTSKDASNNSSESTDATFTTSAFVGKALETAATGNYGIRTAGGFDDTTVYTACFWFMIVTDKNASGCIFGLRDASSKYLYYYNPSGDGTTYLWEGLEGAFNAQSVNWSVGVWHFVAISKAGNGANQVSFYRRDLSDSSLTVVTTTLNEAITPTEDIILTNGFNTAAGYFPGRITSLKQWNAALSEAELLLESQHYNVQRTANLFASYPMDDNVSAASCLLDESGNARHYTQVGTLTLADGPGLIQ